MWAKLSSKDKEYQSDFEIMCWLRFLVVCSFQASREDNHVQQIFTDPNINQAK